MEEIELFGKWWKNSRGETDGWVFRLCGDRVRWSYHALFDAANWEYSDGSASFSRDDFQRLLQIFLERGEANLSTAEADVALERQGDSRIRVSVHLHNGGIGATGVIERIPDHVFEVFGVIHSLEKGGIS